MILLPSFEVQQRCYFDVSNRFGAHWGLFRFRCWRTPRSENCTRAGIMPPHSLFCEHFLAQYPHGVFWEILMYQLPRQQSTDFFSYIPPPFFNSIGGKIRVLGVFASQTMKSRPLAGIAVGVSVGCQSLVWLSCSLILHCRVCRVVFNHILPQTERRGNSFFGRNPPAGSQTWGRINCHTPFTSSLTHTNLAMSGDRPGTLILPGSGHGP
jgi:hypothetical protein